MQTSRYIHTVEVTGFRHAFRRVWKGSKRAPSSAHHFQGPSLSLRKAAHAAIEPSDLPFSLHFGHGGFLNTIVSGVKKISSCQVLPQTGQLNTSAEMEMVRGIYRFR